MELIFFSLFLTLDVKIALYPKKKPQSNRIAAIFEIWAQLI